HGNYRFLPHPATELRSSFHGPDLPDIRGDRHGLDHLSASPLRDRSHLLQWPCRRRTLVAVPSLLQPRRLGHRHLLHAPGQVGRHDSRPGRHLLLGRRRHPLSQTRADPLRRRHALRPSHLQSRQILGQLGTRLGRADPDHRTRPELALELIIMVAQWFPNEEIIVSGDSAYGGQSILSHLPPNVHLISHVHPNGALYEPAPPKKEKRKGPARKKGDRLPGMKQWADDPDRPWTKLEFDQFGLHTTLEVKTIQALYYKAGKDRLLTIVLTRDLEGKRPDQMFYCTKLDWTAREILSAYACRWAIECTFENCKQFLGLEDPANRLPKAVVR